MPGRPAALPPVTGPPHPRGPAYAGVRHRPRTLQTVRWMWGEASGSPAMEHLAGPRSTSGRKRRHSEHEPG